MSTEHITLDATTLDRADKISRHLGISVVDLVRLLVNNAWYSSTPPATDQTQQHQHAAVVEAIDQPTTRVIPEHRKAWR
jgi:hypothetical protein